MMMIYIYIIIIKNITFQPIYNTNPITASIIKNMMIGILSCKYIHKYKNNCIIIVLSFLFINYTAILQDQ